MTFDISICVPVYNAAETLRETLESAVAQEGCSWELIIQDNCSTDQSSQIIKDFQALHAEKPIKVIRTQQNIPAHENWYDCISRAEGEWVKLLFADDLIYPNCLKTQICAGRSSPNIVLVSSKRDIINMRGRVLMRNRGLKYLKGRFNRSQLYSATLKSGTNPIGEPEAVIFRRSVISLVGPFTKDNPYLVDLDYWIRILEHGDGWADNGTHSAFRITSGSASVNLLLQQPKLFAKFIDHHASAAEVRKSNYKIWLSLAKAYTLSIARGLIYLTTLRMKIF